MGLYNQLECHFLEKIELNLHISKPQFNVQIEEMKEFMNMMMAKLAAKKAEE